MKFEDLPELSTNNKVKQENVLQDSSWLQAETPLRNELSGVGGAVEIVGSQTKFAGLDKFDVFTNGVTEDTFVGLLSEPYDSGDKGFVADLTFDDKKKNEFLKEKAPMLRNEYKKQLLKSSNSLEELEYNLPQALEYSRIKDYTDELGFTGMAVELASGLPDALAIMAISLVSPLSATALASTKMRAFVTGAVVDTSLNVLQNEFGQRERTSLEMVLSPIFSGSLNAVLTRGTANALDIHQEIMNYQTKSALGINADVESRIASALTKEEKEEIQKEAIQNALKEQAEIKEAFASKDETLIADVLKKKQDKETADYEAGRLSKGAFNKLRMDNEALGKTSPSAVIRDLANSMFIDSSLQHNNMNMTSLTELQDLYESVSLRNTRDIFTPLERELSELRPKTFSSIMTPKYLQDTGVGISNIAGTVQAIRNLKIGSDDFALDTARTMLLDMGVDEDKTLAFANKILKASKEQSLRNGELAVRFKDKNFVSGKLEPKDDYYTNVFTFAGNAKLMEKGHSMKDINEYWYQALKSDWVKRNTPEDGLLTEKNIFTDAKAKNLRKVASKLARFLGSPSLASHSGDKNNSIIYKAFAEANLTDKEIDELIEVARNKNGSKYMKTRMPIDRSYVHTTDNGSISMIDFISTDMYATQAKYMKENGGRIAGQNYKVDITPPEGTDMTKLTKEDLTTDLSTDEGAEALLGKATGELNGLVRAGKISKGQADSELARLKHWLNHLQGRATAVDPSNSFHKVGQIGANLNAYRLLGSTPLAMVAELNNVTWYTSTINMMKNLKQLKTLAQYFTSGKMDDATWKEAGDIAGIGSEYMQGVRNMVNDHDFDSEIYNAQKGWVDRMLNKGMGVSEKMAEFTLMTGGMKPFNAYLQLSMYTGLVKSIDDAYRNGIKGFNKQLFKEMGIDEAMLKRIGSQMEKYKASGIRTGKPVLNFDFWDDEEASMMMSIGIKRLVDNVVQKPTLGAKLGVTTGDKVIASTVIGKMFLELKQYMLQSYTKQTLKLVDSKSTYHYMMMLSQIGLLTAMYIPEQYAIYAGDEAKLKEKLTPEAIANGVASRVTQFGLPSTVLGAGSRATLGENYFSIGRDVNGGVAQAVMQQLPMIDLLNKLGSVVPNTIKSLYEEDNNASGLIKNGAGLLPNFVPMKSLRHYLENEIEPSKNPF